MVEKRIFNDFINAALYKAIEPLMSSMEWFVVVHVLTISLNGRNWKVCGPIVLTVHRQETARQHDTSWPNVNEVDNKWIEADNVSMFPAVSWTSPGGIHLLYMTMWEPSTWSNCLLPRVRGMRVRPHRKGRHHLARSLNINVLFVFYEASDYV